MFSTISRSSRAAAAAAARLPAHAYATASVFGSPAKHREVFNQSPVYENVNYFLNDPALQEAVQRHGASWAVDNLTKMGEAAGSAQSQLIATQANQNPPVLKTHDRHGRRIDVVQFHPSYHQIMKLGIENQVPGFAWVHADKKGAQVAGATLAYLAYQMESGTQCPQTMTFAAVPALRHMTKEQKARLDWSAKAQTPVYDPRNVPATEKAGVTLGMSMTERQGGSDVRSNTSFATPIDKAKQGPGQGYFLNGHKWFTSAPMCDAFLTLAQTESGPSCFIVPRWVPHTGERNQGLVFLRLKEKLGDKSNASSEVEYNNAYGEMLGAEGRGIATILEMVQHTRLWCALGSASLMRRCVAEAAFHTAHRKAFGSVLNQTDLMRNVLADMIVESEACTTMAFRMAATFDSTAEESEKRFGRLATAVSKYYICKRAPSLSYEAMECLGGNGYIEDSGMPMLFRQSPLNAIWEGSGNVICLDVLRSFQKDPASLQAFKEELSKTLGKDRRYDAFVGKQLVGELEALKTSTTGLRRAVGMMAIALQASLLMQFGHPDITEAFLASRLNPSVRGDFGVLPSNTNFAAIVDRGTPKASL
eukprot:m.116931 g.116931  ORF g.116931 m.116931 type:complete len:590 (-) comp16081_c4_seq1:1376-3145(-)